MVLTLKPRERSTVRRWKVDERKKELKLEFDGETIYLREIEAKIVDPLKSFVDFADQAVALDQSGHAALPWGIIKFVLQAIHKSTSELQWPGLLNIIQPFISDFDQYIAVKEGMRPSPASFATLSI